MARPRRLVAVIGTGTDVGKTWVTARLLRTLRAGGTSVAARKPAQSFDPSDDPGDYDAAVLGAASGELPGTVCPERHWYEVAMAPPMAAEALGRPAFSVVDLVAGFQWPDEAVDVGFLETAGGLRSPIAEDGDCLTLIEAVVPDVVLVVADAGLGTINAVRLTLAALGGMSVPVVVVLNRFDETSELHKRNHAWLDTHEKAHLCKTPGDESELARLVQTAGKVNS